MTDALRRAIEDEGGLATAVDLARTWGVSESRARQIVALDGFPAPVATVSDGRTRLWSVEDAQVFRDAMGR
jgi:hypothetical protein